MKLLLSIFCSLIFLSLKAQGDYQQDKNIKILRTSESKISLLSDSIQINGDGICTTTLKFGNPHSSILSDIKLDLFFDKSFISITPSFEDEGAIDSEEIFSKNDDKTQYEIEIKSITDIDGKKPVFVLTIKSKEIPRIFIRGVNSITNK